MADMPKVPVEIPQQIPLPKVPQLPTELPKLPVDVQGIADRLHPTLSSLIGEVLLGTVAFWLVVLGAAILTLEVIVVTYRMWKGETFLSALLLWGSNRKRRIGSIIEKNNSAASEVIAPTEPIEPLVPPESVTASVADRVSDPEPTAQPVQAVVEPEPQGALVAAEAPVEAIVEATITVEPVVVREPVAHPIEPDPLPSGEDILSDMYAMKIGVLKVLRVHRALEDELGNTSGIHALDVLIGAVEGADPQKIWDMGSRKIKDNTQ